MYKKITVEEALNMDNSIFIDVRSPLEFMEGSIPDAINIPILNNEERIDVGTTYKQNSPTEAKVKGIEYVSSKLPNIYNEILLLSKNYKNIVIFCWRGGLRSGVISNLLGSLGMNIFQLQGGYKEYRKQVVKYFDENQSNHSFIVLHGYTGVGKTEILEKLEEINIPTLNLELIVKNSGSVFGTMAYQNEKPVTQKMFDSIVFDILRKTNSKYIVIESEGQRLGRVTLPESLFQSILKGKQILINTSMENRIERLVRDYVNNISDNDDLLENAILNLKKRIGLERVNQYLDWIKEKSYDKIARELIIEYYDPLYLHSMKNYNYMMEINYNNIEDAVEEIVKLYYSLENKSV